MKKRIVSILLALCMVLCFVPVETFAEGETTKKVGTEQELVNALADGSVDIIILKNDIAINNTLTVDRKVTLDLYGYMLEMKGSGSVIAIQDGGHLTLEDSDPQALYMFTPDADGLWKWGNSGTKTVNGGVIYGGSAEDGGGVYCEGGFTMNGGTIRDCTAFNAGAISYRGEAPLTLNGTVIAGSKDINGNPNPAITGTTIYTVSLPNSKVGDLILGDKADIQADMGISSGTVHANGGVVRGNVHSYRELTFSVDDGVTGSTIIYGQIRGRYITIDGPAVTYWVNGAEYVTQILRSGVAATKPDDPAAEEGYVFAGWFGGNTPYDFAEPVTEDITLTAKWAKLVDKTADFTAPDGGAAAIALLNSAKNGTEDSTWDNGTKTLTLKGVSMATTATTAVKLPAGATVILADGTENHIIGGDTAVSENGKHQKQIYVYGICSAGALTIQGETNGTGTLFVNSGEHINSGNAWTYSIALYADGDLTVKGSAVTAQGGKTSSADCAFSLGVQLSEGHSLSVSGGTLTAIGGESFDTSDPNDVDESFSEGIDIYRGNVTISGNGRVITETVSDMMNKGLSFGLYIRQGSLFVSDSAVLTAKTSQAINISGGDLKLFGGKICSYATSDNAAVSVEKEMFQNSGNGNIEITGGEFECIGGIYMYQSSPANNQGVFSVTAGKLTADSIYGPDKLTVSGGTVTSGRVNANTVELQNGSLTVREPVYKNEYIDIFYAASAIYCKNITVSGGTLDAAWDWGEYTPSVLSFGDPDLLIKVLGGTASFGGGTVILDTGCAGNTAIKAETLNLSGGVVGSGYTNEDGSDSYIQKDSDTPVKFVVYPADYSNVDAALNKVKTLDKNLYKDFSAVETAVNAVVRGKNIDEQADVDAMTKAIEDAVTALEYKDADYSKVDEAIAKANALNKDDYKDFSAVQAAIDAVVRGKNITEQTAVDDMAKTIGDAIGALEKKPAETKPEQGEPPRTGDNVNLTLWLALLFVSGGVCTTLTVKRKKSYRHGGNMR